MGRRRRYCREEILERLQDKADAAAARKASEMGPDMMRRIEKAVLLQTLDYLWREHLVTLDHLRQAVSLRGYAQRDPLHEYKSEAFQLFGAMLARLRRDVTGQLMHVVLAPAPEELEQFAELPEMHAHHVDPATGEDEFLAEPEPQAPAPMSRQGRRAAAKQSQGNRAPAAARKAGGARPPKDAAKGQRARREPGRSLDVGQSCAQRDLPVRLRQKVQALPRRHRDGRRGVAAQAVRLNAAPLPAEGRDNPRLWRPPHPSPLPEGGEQASSLPEGERRSEGVLAPA